MRRGWCGVVLRSKPRAEHTGVEESNSMKRLDRRKFMLLASVGTTGAVLTACGNDPDEVDLTPTMIPDVSGAPPTLAPYATPGGGATEPEDQGGDTGAAG